VIAPKDNFSAKLISEGVSYRHINLDNYGTNPISELRIVRQLSNIYKSEEIDFIFHYTIKPNIYGSIAAKLAGIPSVAITTGLGHLLTFSNWVTRAVSLSLYKIGAALSKEVWFLNEQDRSDFLKLRIVRKKKTFLLPGEGVDTEFFKPKFEKENGSSMRMLFAGRIIWDKGFKEFIDAAKIIKKKYPYCEFNVVVFVDPTNPNGVPYEYIVEHQHSGLINFHGETDDVRPFIVDTHCLIFPSIYREGVSRILLETASMKTPIITTDNVGCKDLVDDNITGLIIPKHDTKALIVAMDKFINMSYQDRLEMGRLARLKIMSSHEQSVINSIYLKRLQSWLPSKTSQVKQPSQKNFS
jgi:glycosyltransferase involved in cell wall biosynthesis